MPTDAQKLVSHLVEALEDVDLDLDLSTLMSAVLVAITHARAAAIHEEPHPTAAAADQAHLDIERVERMLVEAEDLLARTRQSVATFGAPSTSALLGMGPFGLAKGRSLAEVSDAVRRFDLDLDTMLVVTLRPADKFPIEVKSLGSHGIIPTSGT